MNKNLVFKLGFSLLLVTVMVVGFASSSAALKIGPAGCQSTACPFDLSGYTHVGSCSTDYGHGCIEFCTTYRSPNGALCKANCNWA